MSEPLWTEAEEDAAWDESGPRGLAKLAVEKYSAEIDRLNGLLAAIFRETGADPDGNEDWRLATYALDEVQRLRRESDEADDRIVQLERAIYAHRDAIEIGCREDEDLWAVVPTEVAA